MSDDVFKKVYQRMTGRGPTGRLFDEWVIQNGEVVLATIDALATGPTFMEVGADIDIGEAKNEMSAVMDQGPLAKAVKRKKYPAPPDPED